MGKIVISGPQNVSLDGVVQDPDGKEGFSLGGWFVEFGGKDLEEWNKVALDEALGAEAWLLGRRSYDFFGERWRRRSGELADRLAGRPPGGSSSLYALGATSLGASAWNSAASSSICPRPTPSSPIPPPYIGRRSRAQRAYTSNSARRLAMRDGLTFTTRAGSGVAPMSSAVWIGAS